MINQNLYHFWTSDTQLLECTTEFRELTIRILTQTEANVNLIKYLQAVDKPRWHSG